MPNQSKEVDILQGTLNMMILQVLHQGPSNGYEIAKYIEHRSDELLQVEHGSLYPALRRLEAKGLIQRSGESRKPTGKRAITRLPEPGENRPRSSTRAGKPSCTR